MATRQEMASRPSTEAQVQAQGQGQLQQKPELALASAADIFEDADGISILLDMPGVTKERLTVKADRNELVIEGEAAIDMPQGMEAAYAEVRSAHYRRSFVLTNELDTGTVEASMKDGVLSIRVPKRAELKPRQIEVQAT
ncbi:MAG: Hsp20/alpha crystallin family protein [Steroidobacteraceae bacterium]